MGIVMNRTRVTDDEKTKKIGECNDMKYGILDCDERKCGKDDRGSERRQGYEFNTIHYMAPYGMIQYTHPVQGRDVISIQYTTWPHMV